MEYPEYEALVTRLMAMFPNQPFNEGNIAAYYDALKDLSRDQFAYAVVDCGQKFEWFPSVAQLRSSANDFKAQQHRNERMLAEGKPQPELTCPYCLGIRWVRTGGPSPLNALVGMEEAHAVPCPGCTTDGVYDEGRERYIIDYEGGAINQNADKVIDMSQQTWPQRMDELRDPTTGKIDMDKLYRHSRELRGLDPDIDERQKPVAGWKPIARAS